MGKIETVIFDLGGVLIDWNPRYVYDTIFDSSEEVDFFLSEVCNGEWNGEQDRGRSFQDAIDIKTKEFPKYAKEIQLYFTRWSDMVSGEMPKSVEILKKISQLKGVRLYALTNWSDETFPYAWENFEFLKLFEGILVSGKEKLIKPDHDIYNLILDRYDITPETAVFIDDSLKNVVAANQVGIQGIHFISAEQLEKSLIDLGVLL